MDKITSINTNTKINSEMIFDILPHAMDIFDKLNIQKEAQKIVAKNKTVDPAQKQKEIGIALFAYIIRNSGKVKDEFFAIVAVIQGISVEDAKKQGIMQTIKVVQEIIKNEEIMSFFQ